MSKLLPKIVIFVITLAGFSLLLAQDRDLKRFKERYRVPANKVLQVNIDIDAAEVEVRPSPRHLEARVTIYYVENEFRVKVFSDFDKGRSVLDVEFDREGWVNSHDDDLRAEAIIELPTGADIDLHAKVKAGEINIDLGGLSLVDVDITTWAGAVDVEFSEPNQTEMDHLKINTKIGETEINRIGNARFKEAEINGGIGEMKIDFRGNFLSRATANVDLDIGETRLLLDEELGVKLSVSKFLFLSDIELPKRFQKSGRYYYTKNYDGAKTALVLHVSPGLGALQIDH